VARAHITGELRASYQRILIATEPDINAVDGQIVEDVSKPAASASHTVIASRGPRLGPARSKGCGCQKGKVIVAGIANMPL
jgi:hypothetical protein